MASCETAMDYSGALRSVSAWRRTKRDWEERHGNVKSPRWGLTMSSGAKPGHAMDRYYSMVEPEYSEIYDAEVYEKCKQVIALRNIGFTNYEVDKRYGWPQGTTGDLEYKHPRLMRRAEQVHIEMAYRMFHQAKVRELEILASTVVPAVILLGQVVNGGAEFSPQEYKSRLSLAVSGTEVSLSNRITAAKTLLGFAQERMKAAVKEEGSPLEGAPPLPKEFTDRLSEAQDVALKLVPLAQQVGGK